MWRDVSPRGMIADFVTVWKQAGTHRWRIAALSAACTISVFSMLVQEGGAAPHAAPEVTYITSWHADRSDEEIIASNIANQKRKELLAAEQAAREEKAREVYRTLARMSGMDVEKIEAEAAVERAAEEKAQRDAIAKRRAQASGE